MAPFPARRRKDRSRRDLRGTSTVASVLETPPAGTGLDKAAARVLGQALGQRVRRVDDFRGDLAITVAPAAWVEAATLLRDHPDLDFKLFLDLCAVDWLDDDAHDDRFEVVLHLYSVARKHHVRLKTSVPEAHPHLP